MSIRSKFAGKSAMAVALLAGCAVAAFALQPGTAQAKAKCHIKIGMATMNAPQQNWGQRIGEEIKKRSGGKCTFGVFPASQLGKIPRQVEGIQLGTQEMFLTPPGFLVGLNQSFMVPDAPGLFHNHTHAHKTLTDSRFHDKFLGMAENKGVYGAGLLIYEGTAIASTKAIRKPEDISGMKIRVLATPMERAVPAAWGGTGVPIPFTEVVPAIQRGVVDACRSSIVAMNGLKFQTVTKYATVLSGGYIPTATWVSKAWVNKLPKDLRTLVLSVPRELEDSVSQEVVGMVESTRKAWQKAGVEIIKFSPADQKRYLAKLRPLGDKFLAQHKNQQVRDMYALLKKVAKDHQPGS